MFHIPDRQETKDALRRILAEEILFEKTDPAIFAQCEAEADELLADELLASVDVEAVIEQKVRFGNPMKLLPLIAFLRESAHQAQLRDLHALAEKNCAKGAEE
jgi:hypothetical protein